MPSLVAIRAAISLVRDMCPEVEGSRYSTALKTASTALEEILVARSSIPRRVQIENAKNPVLRFLYRNRGHRYVNGDGTPSPPTKTVSNAVLSLSASRSATASQYSGDTKSSPALPTISCSADSERT